MKYPGLLPPKIDEEDSDRILEWVAYWNLPGEVFGDYKIIECVLSKWPDPGEIYSEEALKRWAIANGYLKTQV